jgi:competence protein CoiA
MYHLSMQLYAIDQKGTPVLAATALKKFDYSCLECGGTVRLREGERRQPHFYHLNPPASCRQSAKSLTHLAIQNLIASQLPRGTISLERRFPTINRIADLAWEEEKLVFEVQCSPMPREEMLQRTTDYASLGYQVIWILHERNYNKYRVSNLEAGIAAIPHYYTDIGPGGEGVIYDQWHLTSAGLRVKGLPRLAVDLSKPARLVDHAETSLKLADERIAAWKIYFKGDLIDLALHEPHSPYLQTARASEKEAACKENQSYIAIASNYYKATLLKILKGYCT